MRSHRRTAQRADAVDRAFQHATDLGALHRWSRIPDTTPDRPFWTIDPQSATVQLPERYLNLHDAELVATGLAAALTVTTEAA